MGVTINKKKNTGDWYIWISYKGQRTSRKIGKDRRTAMKAATEYRKKLALGQISVEEAAASGNLSLEGDMLGLRDFLENFE